MTAVVATEPLVRAASLAELREAGRLVVHLDRHTLGLFADGDEVYAVDNRCPHMGFPLHRGTVCEGILTCHWHHARFDLSTGGTFDQFADELRRFPVELDGDAVLVDLSPPDGAAAHQRKRLRDGLEPHIALVSAVRGGASPQELADMLFAAATDHRYLDSGHTLDFVNKALEALDVAGWDRAEAVLASLAALLAASERMEEANAWRNPVDLIALLQRAFDELPQALSAGAGKRGGWDGRAALVEAILDAEAATMADALLEALRAGATEVELASAVSFAAATRIARFPTSNEFGDWDTALHTFTFANAVEQGLRRSPSAELLRGVLDAAASVHLDRFLNVPATRLPSPDHGADPARLLDELPRLLDRQQQVDEAGRLVASYLAAGGPPAELVAALGAALVREDRNFHTIQCLEATVRQSEVLAGADDAALPLIAAARYLAAHATTTRSQRQTFEIARRLHRGERLYEEVI